jgi:pimeloyl-ACP methyl ester carboxylesterase
MTVSWPWLTRVTGRPRPRFPYLATPLSSTAYDELAHLEGWAKSLITVAPGVKLRGLVRNPKNPESPWVLYYPGNDRTQLRTGQAFLATLFGTDDLGLAVFAYRGFDGSDGKPEYAALAHDAPLILDSLCKQQRIRQTQVHVVGFSIGGHFSAIAARSANIAGTPIKTLSLLASVSDIVMVRSSRFERFFSGDDYLTLPLLEQVPAPVLVLQGTNDEALGGAQQGRDIARALGRRAQYAEFEGVGHVSLHTHEPAMARLRAFILTPSR